MPKVKRLAGGGDTAAGDILWLGPWPFRFSKPTHNIFDHPVMIVSVDTSQQMACVLIISSLGGKNLANYNSRVIRAEHLPIDPCPAHPDTGELLFLKSSLQLQKNSYIKTKTRYRVPTWLIKFGYRGHVFRNYQLRNESLAKVHVAVDANIPIENAMISEGAQSGALNSELIDQTLPLASRGATFYGSTLQSHHTAQPLSKTAPRTPLSLTRSVEYPANYVSISAHGPADLTRDYSRSQNHTAFRTSPLLPVYAQSRAHQSGWLASLSPCLLILFAFLLLVFFLYMAYWIHKLNAGA